jgi:hypothetical protein
MIPEGGRRALGAGEARWCHEFKEGLSRERLRVKDGSGVLRVEWGCIQLFCN